MSLLRKSSILLRRGKKIQLSFAGNGEVRLVMSCISQEKWLILEEAKELYAGHTSPLVNRESKPKN